MLNPDIRQAVLQRLRQLGWDAYSEHRQFVVRRFETAAGEKQASACVTADRDVPGQFWIRGNYFSNVYQDSLANCVGFIAPGATTKEIEASVLIFHTAALTAIDQSYARSLWLQYDAPKAKRHDSVPAKVALT